MSHMGAPEIAQSRRAVEMQHLPRSSEEDSSKLTSPTSAIRSALRSSSSNSVALARAPAATCARLWRKSVRSNRAAWSS